MFQEGRVEKRDVRIKPAILHSKIMMEVEDHSLKKSM
jgi:hypothetical protein